MTASEQQDEYAAAHEVVVHAAPRPDTSGLMPCCGKTPLEVPRLDRITLGPHVTCGDSSALAHTPTIGSKIRAAIEADVLRRVADRFQREWPVYGDDWLRAEADRIEEGAGQ